MAEGLKPILLHDHNGLQCWAFSPFTDPDEVLWYLMLSHTEGRLWAICSNKQNCPGAEGRYCLDCHAVAWAARSELANRGYK